ncbi:MAG TPA: helix-turn-helix transcriptional regulator, partial [Hyalangium sp.]|nr:helix-turn-helix transcriptional regulator [Hyalangium sp.]
SVLNSLTQREREVLAYVAGGADNLKIAAHLQIAERTVKSHVTQLYRKLGAENRTQLALRACHLGVRPPPDL